MLLEELNLGDKKLKQFKKKKINTTEDLIYTFPKKYYDFRMAKTVYTATSGERCIMIGTVIKVKKETEKNYVEAVVTEYKTKKLVTVRWFSQPHKYYEISNLHNVDVVIGGVFKNDNWGPQFVNPDIFSTDIENTIGIIPVYPKVAGMSTDYYIGVLSSVLKNINNADIEPLTDEFKNHFELVSEEDMINLYHNPKDIDDIKKANKKQVFNKLHKVAYKMVTDADSIERFSMFRPKLLSNTNKLLKDLPYELTEDQKKIIKEFVYGAKEGKRVNALIQGDVGSGKTVCAFVLMFAMADNGYQSVLMAPTGVLAKQHYKELCSYAEKYGYKVVYLGGDLKAKEKKEVLKDIKEGNATFVVGTHAVISDDVEFKNLALTIVDEEHKFGVIQRENLKKKASEGVHSVSMSATPIPRSLALTLYGDAMDVYTISTMPGGRLPVKTAVVNDDRSIFRFMQKEIENGHQCYIVCPLIENNDDDDREPPESVEEVYQKTCNYFTVNKLNVKVSVITGKMKDEEKTRIIEEFSRNESQVLIATTIIETGVNIPNATVITVMNAERFGLAGLHQLRGRVGRSNIQSYCMLKSLEKNNDRLRVMCETTDGFKIAEEDLKIRGTGDILGTRQSGEDENVKLMLTYPKIYEDIRDYIRKNEVNNNEDLKL